MPITGCSQTKKLCRHIRHKVLLLQMPLSDSLLFLGRGYLSLAPQGLTKVAVAEICEITIGPQQRPLVGQDAAWKGGITTSVRENRNILFYTTMIGGKAEPSTCRVRSMWRFNSNTEREEVFVYQHLLVLSTNQPTPSNVRCRRVRLYVCKSSASETIDEPINECLSLARKNNLGHTRDRRRRRARPCCENGGSFWNQDITHRLRTVASQGGNRKY